MPYAILNAEMLHCVIIIIIIIIVIIMAPCSLSMRWVSCCCAMLGLPFAMICKLRTVLISSTVSCCRWTIVWWTVQGVCTFAAVCAAFVFFYIRL